MGKYVVMVLLAASTVGINLYVNKQRDNLAPEVVTKTEVVQPIDNPAPKTTYIDPALKIERCKSEAKIAANRAGLNYIEETMSKPLGCESMPNPQECFTNSVFIIGQFRKNIEESSYLSNYNACLLK